MRPGFTILHANAGQIAAAVADHYDVDHLIPTLTAIVCDAAAKMDLGVAVDCSALLDAGIDEPDVARILRDLVFEGFERMRGELSDTDFAEAALMLRSVFHAVIPRPEVAEEERVFYRRLMAGGEAGEEGDRLLTLFRDLTATFHDVIYVHDANGMMLYINEPGLKVTGYTVADLEAGLSIYDFVVPEFLDLIEARMESPGAVARTPYTSEIYAKSGERIPIEISTNVLREGRRLTGVLGVARDLRLARRLESEIRRSNAYVEHIVDSAPFGIVLTDGQCLVVDANPKAVSLFGAPNAQAMTGTPLYRLCEEETEAMYRLLSDTYTSGKKAHRRIATPTAFGAQLQGEVTVIPIREQSGCVDSLLVLIADVTRQVALQVVAAQRETLATLGEMVTVIGHELNNPLTGVLGYGQLLSNSKLEPSAQARVDKLMLEAERCQKLVQNLLIYAHRHEPVKQPESINAIVSAAVQSSEKALREAGVVVRIELHESLPKLPANPEALGRVFTNIIINAIEAMEGLEPAEKCLTVRTRTRDESIHVAFSNSGPLIPAQHQGLVFNPFFSTKGAEKHDGLGLSVAYGIVRRYGGHIQLRSREGEQTTFSVVLPLFESS